MAFDERALLEDANRLKILELLQYQSIDKDVQGYRTPYQEVLAQMAEKYGVPSITDRGRPLQPAPQVPEGKIRNE